MVNNMYFKYFEGKFINALVTDVNDNVFAQIGKLGTEEYAPNEMVWVGKWEADRYLTQVNIKSIQATLCREAEARLEHNKPTEFMPWRVRAKIDKSREIKLDKRMIKDSQIEEFLNGDLWYLKKKLQVSFDTLQDLPRIIKEDLEKFPAGFGRWAVTRFAHFKNSTLAMDDYIKYWNNIIQEAPKKLRKLKWIVANVIPDWDKVRLNTKWDYYCSISVVPEMSINMVKAYYKDICLVDKFPRKVSLYYAAAQYLRDYLDFMETRGNILKPSMRSMQECITWHKQGCPGRNDPGDCVMFKDPNQPEILEQFRIKTGKEMVDLGIECHHCLGTKWRNPFKYSYYTIATPDRSSVVCAEVDIENAKIVQCYDRYNKETEQALEFRKLLRNAIGEREVKEVEVEEFDLVF
jgi:hypothetical protein